MTTESFARAVADAAPGQTLVLADGVYHDVKWGFSAKGESDKPIVLQAQTPGKVFIVGRSELTVAGEHLVVSGLVFDQVWGKKVVELPRAQHCRLTDCAFVSCGNTGELVRFDAQNDQLWRATSVWAQGQANPGAQPPGVKVERVAVLRPERITEFKADVAPILAAMSCPRSFEEACPAKLEVRALEPREVGPVWMRGDPRQVARLGARKAVPDPVNPKPKKKS